MPEEPSHPDITRHMKKQIVLHLNKVVATKDGKFYLKTEIIEVELMAEKNGFCMVRRKGCMPYVARKKEIVTKQEKAE
jgi:hypothetical protein